ncbi:MAG: hypothetical protein L6Q73_20645 [Aquabacterium sp.]|jgi:hypothetical protein|nr:hypothetical protein [Aquabacterium sp.]
MESGNDALRAEDRGLLLVNRLTMAGARPALVMELMGRLVKKSEIGYRMRVTRSTEDVDDRGRAPGRRFLERLPKDGSAVLAHVLYNMAQAQARCSSADQCWQASARARVEVLLAGWELLKTAAQRGNAAAAGLKFEQLERADYFVLRERSVALVLCEHCATPNLRGDAAVALCAACNRKVRAPAFDASAR